MTIAVNKVFFTKNKIGAKVFFTENTLYFNTGSRRPTMGFFGKWPNQYHQQQRTHFLRAAPDRSPCRVLLLQRQYSYLSENRHFSSRHIRQYVQKTPIGYKKRFRERYLFRVVVKRVCKADSDCRTVSCLVSANRSNCPSWKTPYELRMLPPNV